MAGVLLGHVRGGVQPLRARRGMTPARHYSRYGIVTKTSINVGKLAEERARRERAELELKQLRDARLRAEQELKEETERTQQAEEALKELSPTTGYQVIGIAVAGLCIVIGAIMRLKAVFGM